MKYEFTPLESTPGPVSILITMTFPCKWCGLGRVMTDGVTEAHECTVHHSVNEDLDFILDMVRQQEGTK